MAFDPPDNAAPRRPCNHQPPEDFPQVSVVGESIVAIRAFRVVDNGIGVAIGIADVGVGVDNVVAIADKDIDVVVNNGRYGSWAQFGSKAVP